MSILDVSREVFVKDLNAVLPTIIVGSWHVLWSLTIFWLAFRRGWKRGVNDADKVADDELRQFRFEKGVAEERLDAERKMSRRLQAMVKQFVDSKHETEAQAMADVRRFKVAK